MHSGYGGYGYGENERTRRGSATSAVSVSSTRPGRSQGSLVAPVADAAKRRVPIATAFVSSVNSSVGAATGASRGPTTTTPLGPKQLVTVTARGKAVLMLLRSQVHNWDFGKRLLQHG